MWDSIRRSKNPGPEMQTRSILQSIPKRIFHFCFLRFSGYESFYLITLPTMNIRRSLRTRQECCDPSTCVLKMQGVHTRIAPFPCSNLGTQKAGDEHMLQGHLTCPSALSHAHAKDRSKHDRTKGHERLMLCAILSDLIGHECDCTSEAQCKG